MQQPGIPTAPSSQSKKTMKKKVPTPEEMISHYESQGMDSHQASLRVIADLQKLLFRVVSSSSGKGKGKKNDRSTMADTFRKMDAACDRLAVMEMKLDSKPGYGEAFAIGVASGAALNGIGALIPHVWRSLSQIWGTVGSLNDSNPHSPSSSL